MNPKLETLLKLPNTWQASRGPRPHAVIPTGYTELDQALHQRGWPQTATTELLLQQAGVGELGLLLPGLLAQQARAPWLVMIDPPYTPFAPALDSAGIDLQRLLILRPRNPAELLWSADQCLSSGSCSAVLTWAIGKPLLDRDLRRLQQSASGGNCWHLLFRHQQQLSRTSPSALRISLKPQARGYLALHIIKQRGGWGGQELSLLPHTQPQPQPSAQPLYQGPLPTLPETGEQQALMPTAQAGRVVPLAARTVTAPSARG